MAVTGYFFFEGDQAKIIPSGIRDRFSTLVIIFVQC
jgi:hypothetical protein